MHAIQQTITLNVQLPLLILGYNTPVFNTASNKNDIYALAILAELLAGTSSARLYRKLVQEEKIAASIRINYSPYDLMDNQWLIRAIPLHPHLTPQLEKIIFKEISVLQEKLISMAELNRIKKQMLATKIYAEDLIANQAIEIGGLEAVGISWEELDEQVNNVFNITPEALREAAQRYLIHTELNTLYVMPERNSQNV